MHVNWTAQEHLMFAQFVSTDEDDLENIVTKLDGITDVEGLGLGLGIRMSALEKIKADSSCLDEQKRKVIYYWLTRRDITRYKHNEVPTWNALADAVKKYNPSLSESIRQ